MTKETVKATKKEEITFEAFLEDAGPENMEFVRVVDALVVEYGCKRKIEAAKSGYVLSYLLPKTKKTLLNYVFRKNGMHVRVYGDGVGSYAEFLALLPADMRKAVEDAPPCKRLTDGGGCNSRCPMGYMFALNGTDYKKCRYSCFFFDVKDENHAVLRSFIEKELASRAV